MENNNEIIRDLKGLVNIVNDGKEGYESAAEATENPALKALFTKYSAQRAGYAQELKDHIAAHGGESTNEEGGILGVIHRTWIDIKQSLSSNEDEAILDAVVTGERAAVEKYDAALQNEAEHADYMGLLRRQRAGIADALADIESRR
jgi:uncharacterized protein (TIGR02284 family)